MYSNDFSPFRRYSSASYFGSTESSRLAPRQPPKQPGPPEPKPPEAQAVVGTKGRMLGTTLLTKREDARPGIQIEFRFAMAAITFPKVSEGDIVSALESACRAVFGARLEKLKFRKNQHMRLDLFVASPSIEQSDLDALARKFERQLKAAPETLEPKLQRE